ncbi:hypothetical protein [Egicoccus sp. AB-alg2]|uniref:hypothetical protein n=1 Tax=Egicoccus sp. AB-alg2 TaxID=3242693 RepID=UPI00359DB9EE
MDVLAAIHQGTGYLVAVIVLVVAGVAFGRARDAREFTPGPYAFAAVMLDLQVLLGLAVYGMGQYWEHPSALLRYVHPVLAVLALVAAHLGVKRGRRQRMAVAAHQAAGRGLVVALVLAFGAVLTATVGARGIL